MLKPKMPWMVAITPNVSSILKNLKLAIHLSPYAQQSQINVAYCHWKDGELAQAITAVDRFLQLHPGHPSVDYAYYLKGLITFNDNMGFFGQTHWPRFE